ncbi:MAG TPA: OmpH family outer membrane protein [Rhodothermales bacterium]|nr:OmpH family outer membrane protein [Rhodothermales bacterium]
MLKRIVGLFALAALVLPAAGLVQHAQAQSLKVGYTDHELLIVNMPEYAQVQQQLQEEYANGQQQLQTLAASYQEEVQDYQKRQSLMTDEARQAKEKELLQTQQDLQKQASDKEQALQQHQAELMAPLWEKVGTAIDAVAKEEGLDLVLRAQIGAAQPLILYANPEHIVNITDDVARRLGIQVDESKAPAESSTPAVSSAPTNPAPANK